jgi:hypothetical protein
VGAFQTGIGNSNYWQGQEEEDEYYSGEVDERGGERVDGYQGNYQGFSGQSQGFSGKSSQKQGFSGQGGGGGLLFQPARLPFMQMGYAGGFMGAGGRGSNSSSRNLRNAEGRHMSYKKERRANSESTAQDSNYYVAVPRNANYNDNHQKVHDSRFPNVNDSVSDTGAAVSGGNEEEENETNTEEDVETAELEEPGEGENGNVNGNDDHNDNDNDNVKASEDNDNSNTNESDGEVNGEELVDKREVKEGGSGGSKDFESHENDIKPAPVATAQASASVQPETKSESKSGEGQKEAGKAKSKDLLRCSTVTKARKSPEKSPGSGEGKSARKQSLRKQHQEAEHRMQRQNRFPAPNAGAGYGSSSSNSKRSGKRVNREAQWDSSPYIPRSMDTSRPELEEQTNYRESAATESRRRREMQKNYSRDRGLERDYSEANRYAGGNSGNRNGNRRGGNRNDNRYVMDRTNYGGPGIIHTTSNPPTEESYTRPITRMSRSQSRQSSRNQSFNSRNTQSRGSSQGSYDSDSGPGPYGGRNGNPFPFNQNLGGSFNRGFDGTHSRSWTPSPRGQLQTQPLSMTSMFNLGGHVAPMPERRSLSKPQGVDARHLLHGGKMRVVNRGHRQLNAFHWSQCGRWDNSENLKEISK